MSGEIVHIETPGRVGVQPTAIGMRHRPRHTAPQRPSAGPVTPALMIVRASGGMRAARVRMAALTSR
jgi:hypothetical protein